MLSESLGRGLVVQSYGTPPFYNIACCVEARTKMFFRTFNPRNTGVSGRRIAEYFQTLCLTGAWHPGI